MKNWPYNVVIMRQMAAIGDNTTKPRLLRSTVKVCFLIALFNLHEVFAKRIRVTRVSKGNLFSSSGCEKVIVM